ncbi:MAG: hypothetical protein JKX94_12960 [Sneathiella sp.]|nr:hypothetical protein [Sneathiella sp.]
MEITQDQVNAIEKWIEFKKNAYVLKGFSLAAQAGIETLEEYKSGEGISEEDSNKTLQELKAELELAEEFHRDARQMLYAGRQGG